MRGELQSIRLRLQKRQVRFSPKRIIGTDRTFGRAKRAKPEELFHSSIPRVAMKEFDEESGFICLIIMDSSC